MRDKFFKFNLKENVYVVIMRTGNQMDETRKQIAVESLKTKKIREKLAKQLDEYDKKTTPQAIERKAIEIHNWIARHAPERVPLKNKNISLFDENQHAASISRGLCRRVSEIAEQLRAN